jgi:hypothetical protein
MLALVSARSAAMRIVVAAVAPELEDAGFGKQRHSFNRTTEPGVVQVVDFQMQPYRVPPGSPVPPGLVDGSFTINLGAYADALVVEPFEPRNGQWVSEYQCQIRARIGVLLQGHDHDQRAVEPWSGTSDLWWSLADVDLATAAARSALRDHGLPWLNALGTEDAVIDLLRAPDAETRGLLLETMGLPEDDT